MTKSNMKTLRHLSHLLKAEGFHVLAFIFALFALVFSGIERSEERVLSSDDALSVRTSFDREAAQSWLNEKATDFVHKLNEHQIHHATVYHRVKSEESAMEKAGKRGIPFTELNDLYGMRVVVDNELDVYQTLNLIRATYPVVPGSIKNYIANPKPSGYQSVHVVTEIDHKRVEFQLRTTEMHLQAEAEHEAYKARMRAA